MKLTCIVHYRTLWGETLYISGDSPTLGSWDEAKARPLTYTPDDQWLIELELPEPSPNALSYRYLVRDEEGRISRREGLLHHHITLRRDVDRTYAFDSWLDTPQGAFPRGSNPPFPRHASNHLPSLHRSRPEGCAAPPLGEQLYARGME